MKRKFDSVQLRSLISPPFQIITSSDASLQGWEASCQGQTTKGAWSVEDNCFVAQDSQASYNALYNIGEGWNISSHLHGQRDSPVILNENGRYQKPGAICDQQSNLAIPFETKDHDYCQILISVIECGGRLGIQANLGFQPMETKLKHLWEIVFWKN